MTYIHWPDKARNAEAAGDWDEAKRCWYYAAQNVYGSDGDLRAEYNRREDAADEMRKLHEKVPRLILGKPITQLTKDELYLSLMHTRQRYRHALRRIELLERALPEAELKRINEELGTS